VHKQKTRVSLRFGRSLAGRRRGEKKKKKRSKRGTKFAEGTGRPKDSEKRPIERERHSVGNYRTQRNIQGKSDNLLVR